MRPHPSLLMKLPQIVAIWATRQAAGVSRWTGRSSSAL
jgi:hypothetical protein